MIGIALGLALQIGAAPYAAMPGVDSLPRDPVADTLRRAATEFMMTWRREWMQTRRNDTTHLRMASMHCHFDDSRFSPNIIRPRRSRRSFCPIWFPVDDSLRGDEGETVDASLPEAARARMRSERQALIARFERAAAGRWSNPWLVGQLVRFAVDQQDPAVALQAARSCTASPAWCLLLEGYSLRSAGRISQADSTFKRAVAAMEPADRCEWTSVAPLLDERARGAYERIDCAARDSIHATYWWLADPLYIEPGNARRVEHFARQVLVRLHAGLTIDERWDWRARYGADGLATMLIRYGWPSNWFWFGHGEDRGHFNEFLFFRDSSINVAPEYALPRYHSTPPWRAVLDPSSLTAADVQRFAPRLGYGAVDWENDFWPLEHAARPLGPVLDLADQLVIFRRDTDALLAVAMDVPQKFFVPGERVPYDAAVIAARDANDRWVPSRESIVLDGRGTTVLVSPLAPRAQVVSAEMAPADGAQGLAVRVRRAVHPPPPLSALAPGEIAISDPLFFRPGDSADLPANASAAIDMMLGSLSVGTRRVGIFWETYGVAPTDTVDLKLRLIGSDRPGFLRRIGTSLGIMEKRGGEISLSWREPRLGQREGLSWAGDVPIQARAIVVDLSRVRSGRYIVELSVVKRGTSPAMTRREITIGR